MILIQCSILTSCSNLFTRYHHESRMHDLIVSNWYTNLIETIAQCGDWKHDFGSSLDLVSYNHVWFLCVFLFPWWPTIIGYENCNKVWSTWFNESFRRMYELKSAPVFQGWHVLSDCSFGCEIMRCFFMLMFIEHPFDMFK